MNDDPQDPDAPVWGANGWPRLLPSGLDEGDRLLIQSMLELSPLERLQELASSGAAIDTLRRGRVRTA